MSKEQLVKIDPKNLEYCSIELKSLLNKKLKDRDLKLEVNIYSDTNSPLNVEVEENSLYYQLWDIWCAKGLNRI